MLHTATALGGMMTAPHHLATEAGLRVLRDGGNATEAMVAAAAAIAVVYPHMNGVGGDGFWLIAQPGQAPVGVDAAGWSAAMATPDYYKSQGLNAIPARGPLAALNVAGTIAGWKMALEIGGAGMPLERLLEDAITHATNGVPVTKGQEDLSREKFDELKDAPGFAQTYLPGGEPPLVNEIIKFPALADTLKRLADKGLDDFYRGETARSNAAYLESVGSPLRFDDFSEYEARQVKALSAELSSGTVYNMPPPTQGVSALMILALFERLGVRDAEGFDHVHGLVEASKQAFILRNAHVTDPAFMTADPNDWLKNDFLDGLVNNIDLKHALEWPQPTKPGDTIWMGCIDKNGQAVSFIQSVYWEFGSGVTNPETGVVFQNRGNGFTLDQSHPNVLAPRKRPFHTLNPAMARLNDGRVLSYGTMGGEGQPQTQAAVFSRYVMFGQPLQHAITQPRWLLGRTWGEESTTLKLESRFDPALIDALKNAGHNVDVMEDFTSTMGHAGAVCRHESGLFEGATDPRSDGRAAGF
ncbi:MAG: gamma-glutamyltransferase family protein [Rhodospirillales bacterium]|nr:gamma-glutamyltransferase family protein [Rhodospirillales bacterium]